ncbi:ABC transporter type 1, transmembrane domain-containing protein [Chytridium lagenaria]|nr:ABC transporter type 1, transmembrane domain-containing protein [Chytridium lagenaria]
MSFDAGTIGDWVGFINAPVITAIQIILCVGALILILGWPSVPGIVCLTVLLFSGGPLTKYVKQGYQALKGARDRRVNAFNEIMQGIKIIKFFAWEPQFNAKIKKMREEELTFMWNAQVLYTFSRVLWYSAPFVTTLVTLGVYTGVAGKELTAEVAFMALALFSFLRQPLQSFPDTIIQLLDAWISVGRIATFLQEEELEDLDGPSIPYSPTNPYLGFTNNATFVWEKPTVSTPPTPAPRISTFLRWTRPTFTPTATPDAGISLSFTLRDLNLTFPTSELSVIVGATGSGKSSLLMALLGEMHRTAGHVHRPHTHPIATFHKSHGLPMPASAITSRFGEKLDEERYRRVIRACALERDLELLDGGDLTEVGEKGINLSGGQKQRIALARAAYSTASIVVLDDPLSAVDAPTARHIMEECVMGILVTNAAGLAIPRGDFLVVMEKGRVVHRGIGALPSTVSVNLAASLGSIRPASVSSTPTLMGSLTSDSNSAFVEGLKEMTETILNERTKYRGSRVEVVEAVGKGVLADRSVATTLVEVEKMEEGRVTMDAVGGFAFFAVLVSGYALNHGMALFLDYIVSMWCRAYNEVFGFLGVSPVVKAFLVEPAKNGVEALGLDRIALKFIPMYGVVMCVVVMTILGRLLLSLYGAVLSGRYIHEKLIERVMGAPLRFFEVTPIGRIVNRFTKDIQAVDMQVGGSFGNVIYNMVLILFTIAAISLVVPQLLIAMIPIAFVYFLVAQFFIKTSRSLKRIDSVARSPIFTHFSETLSGVMVIRSFRAVSRFTHESRLRFDAYNRANYLMLVSLQWLSLRIQLIGAVIMLLAGVFVVYARAGSILTGLCLNFSMGLTESLIMLVRNQSWFEMSMNSVERCFEYLKIDQEAAPIVPTSRPPSNWPTEGRISIQDLRFRYAPDLPEVLRGLNAEIGAMEKVGIVGRTGAGKSSLTLALFRMVEPSAGRIWIDGVETGAIGLADLRAGLTIIPQDPVLFTGTIRSNLDPFGTLQDADLWAALKRSHLISTDDTPSEDTDEESSVDLKKKSEEDQKSSVKISLDTSRQLLCLARALARRTKVIVMDEATASETIRSEFNECTVITIAHRLRSIVDYDRVIVLDAGQVIENGSPLDLIENRTLGCLGICECQETGEFEEWWLLRSRELRGSEGIWREGAHPL